MYRDWAIKWTKDMNNPYGYFCNWSQKCLIKIEWSSLENSGFEFMTASNHLNFTFQRIHADNTIIRIGFCKFKFCNIATRRKSPVRLMQTLWDLKASKHWWPPRSDLIAKTGRELKWEGWWKVHRFILKYFYGILMKNWTKLANELIFSKKKIVKKNYSE